MNSWSPIKLVLVFICAIVCALLAPLLFEKAAEKHDGRRFPAPGCFVSGNRLHFLESGAGPTTVLLEAGLAASSISWRKVQEATAGFARVVAYDRAGLGWSVPGDHPPTLHALLADLDSVLHEVSPHAPAILVGHSFGGLLVSAFAHLHAARVAGIVLVDPVSIDVYANSNEDQRRRLALGEKLCRRGGLLARFAIVRAALSLVGTGANRMPRFIGRVSAGSGSSVMSRLATEIAKLPADTHGVIRSHWSRPGSFALLAEYLKLLPESARQARLMPVPAQIPMVVLSAATATKSELDEREGWIRDRPCSRHTQVPETTHWIQLDRPDLIAQAVRQLIIK